MSIYFPNAPSKNVPSAVISVRTVGQPVSRLNFVETSHVHSQVSTRGASVNNVIMGKALLEYFDFTFSVLFQRCSTPIHSYITDAM
jgi:hypothetical protein